MMEIIIVRLTRKITFFQTAVWKVFWSIHEIYILVVITINNPQLDLIEQIIIILLIYGLNGRSDKIS